MAFWVPWASWTTNSELWRMDLCLSNMLDNAFLPFVFPKIGTFDFTFYTFWILHSSYDGLNVIYFGMIRLDPVFISNGGMIPELLLLLDLMDLVYIIFLASLTSPEFLLDLLFEVDCETGFWKTDSYFFASSFFRFYISKSFLLMISYMEFWRYFWYLSLRYSNFWCTGIKLGGLIQRLKLLQRICVCQSMWLCGD